MAVDSMSHCHALLQMSYMTSRDCILLQTCKLDVPHGSTSAIDAPTYVSRLGCTIVQWSTGCYMSCFDHVQNQGSNRLLLMY